MANLATFNRTIQDPRTGEYLESVLREKKNTFVASLVSVVANNANLQVCEPLTIMYSAMKATALDLPFDPNLGFAYVIPYENRKERKTEAQFQLGYKGFIQLAMRSGQFLTLNTDVVYEGEISRFNKLSGNIELDGEKKSDKPVGYFAYFQLTNGFEKTLYMTVDEIQKHCNTYSQTGKRGFGVWKDNFDAMAKKTVIKLLLSKYAPLSIDMRDAIKSDQAVFRNADEATYVDNQTQPEQEAAVENAKQKAQAIADRARAAAEPAEEQQQEDIPAEDLPESAADMFPEE